MSRNSPSARAAYERLFNNPDTRTDLARTSFELFLEWLTDVEIEDLVNTLIHYGDCVGDLAINHLLIALTENEQSGRSAD